MVRKFIKIFEKPHLIFWGAIPLLILISFIRKTEMESSALDINIHDTYFVIAHSHFTFITCLFIVFIGLIYYFLYKSKRELNPWLTLVHSLVTILAALFLMYPFHLMKTEQYEGFPTMSSDINVEIVIALLVMVFIQMILLVNVIFSFLRKKGKN